MTTFTYNGNSVSVRNPYFGDAHVLRLNHIIQKTMSGKYRTYKTKIEELFRLEIGGLSKSEKFQLLFLLTDSKGSVIEYTDYNDDVWNVKLLTDPNTITDQTVDNGALTFELQVIPGV